MAIDRIYGSGGGGGESQHIPSETPNTLRTKQLAKIVDVLCEGPIEGWATSDPLENIFLDGVPVKSAGVVNFPGFTYELKKGYSYDQQAAGYDREYLGLRISGPKVVSQTTEGKELTNIVRGYINIDDPDVDEVSINLKTRLMEKQSDGDLVPTSVSYQIYRSYIYPEPSSVATFTTSIATATGALTIGIVFGGAGYPTENGKCSIYVEDSTGTGAEFLPIINSGGTLTGITTKSNGTGYSANVSVRLVSGTPLLPIAVYSANNSQKVGESLPARCASIKFGSYDIYESATKSDTGTFDYTIPEFSSWNQETSATSWLVYKGSDGKQLPYPLPGLTIKEVNEEGKKLGFTYDKNRNRLVPNYMDPGSGESSVPTVPQNIQFSMDSFVQSKTRIYNPKTGDMEYLWYISPSKTEIARLKSTTTLIQIIKGMAGKPGISRPWAASTLYKKYVNYDELSRCTYAGKEYVCTTDHTSTGSFDNTKWKVLETYASEQVAANIAYLQKHPWADPDYVPPVL